MQRTAFLRYLSHLHLRFLQGLFMQCPDPDFQWSPDPDNTRVHIVGDIPVDLARYGMRPCIAVVLGEVAFHSVSLDDMQKLDMHSSKKIRAIMAAGNATINCISSVGQEAQDMAWFVAESILSLRDVLQQAGFHQIGVNMRVGAVSQPGGLIANDGGKSWYSCTALSPYYIQRIVGTTPLDAPIATNLALWLRGMGPDTYETPPPPVAPLSDYGTSTPTVQTLQWTPASSLPRPGVEVEQHFEGVPSAAGSVGEYQSSGGIEAIQVLIGDER